MGKLKRQLFFIAFLLIVVDLTCWISLDVYHKARSRQILSNWTEMEMIIVKVAARSSKAWLHEKVTLEKMNPLTVEKEIFTKFIKPIHLLKNGDAWIYNRHHIIYDDSEDLPEEYLGRSIRDIFKIQSINGASHYEALVHGVEEGTEGKDWYIWLPEKGKEYAAWTSIKMGEETWTIGLSTPEQEILENAGHYSTRRVERISLSILSLLLLLLFLVILSSRLNDYHQFMLLNLANQQKNELIQEIREKSNDLSKNNIQLLKFSRAKDEFLANMSHELRTPLHAIIGLSEALGENAGHNLIPEQTQKINHVLESGKALLSLINDILDLAKIESGKINMDCQKVAIRSLCSTCMHIIEPLAEKKGITVSLSIDPEIIYCWGDEIRLKQILINLLGNAVKFTPEGNKIGLTITGDPSQDCVNFEVWDSGIGIDSTHMRQVFEPFTQLDSKLSRLYGGSGLGLTLAFRFVRLLAGSITLISQKSEGCSFLVKIPMNKPTHSVCFLQRCEWKGIIYTESETLLNQLHELEKDPHSPHFVYIKQPFEPENCEIPADADFLWLDLPLILPESMEMVETIRGLAGNPKLPAIFSIYLDLPDSTTILKNISNCSYILHPLPLAFLLKSISTIILKD